MDVPKLDIRNCCMLVAKYPNRKGDCQGVSSHNLMDTTGTSDRGHLTINLVSNPRDEGKSQVALCHPNQLSRLVWLNYTSSLVLACFQDGILHSFSEPGRPPKFTNQTQNMTQVNDFRRGKFAL